MDKPTKKKPPITSLLEFLTKKRGLELPEDVSQETLMTSSGIRDVIGFAITRNKSGGALLLSLIPTLFGGASTRAQVVQPHDSGTPGFANKPLAQPEHYTPNAVQATMTQQSVVAAVVIREHSDDEKYIRSIINTEVPRNVVASCEDLLINGDGSGFTGLLQSSDEERLKPGEKQIDFFYRVLEEYASRAGRMPTHILLPYAEILRLLLSKQRMTYAAQSFRHKCFEVFGVPVIASDALPNNRGLLLAADEMVLAFPPGLKWKFGYRNSELESLDLAAIMLEFKMGLMVKRPEAIKQLSLHTPFVRNHTSDTSETFDESQLSEEAQDQLD